MKRIPIIIIAALLSAALLAGCSGVPGASKAPATEAPEATTEATAAPAAGAGTMAGAYTKLVEAKGAALTRLTEKMGTHDELAMYTLALLPATLYDLALLPISVAETPEGASALEMLGMSGIDVKKDGNVYTVSYTSKDSEGAEQKAVQTCEFDAATESLRSVIADESGKEAMIFESVKAGAVYAVQYYAVDDESGTSIVTVVFNDTDLVAVGMQSATEKPASIFKNTSVTVDLVKGAEMYMILEGDKLTVHENGADKTYD